MNNKGCFQSITQDKSSNPTFGFCQSKLAYSEIHFAESDKELSCLKSARHLNHILFRYTAKTNTLKNATAITERQRHAPERVGAAVPRPSSDVGHKRAAGPTAPAWPGELQQEPQLP